MADSAAEAAVKKLARHGGNMTCPNCGAYKKFGFSSVCIKYWTFVCNNCKASHAAISHRCKSLTMSSWTQAEVLQLKTHGNDHARATWLARAPPVGQGGRPKEDDHIDVFKAFIVNCYEKKMYYSEPNGAAGGGGGGHQSQPSQQQQQPRQQQQVAPPVRRRHAEPQPSPPPAPSPPPRAAAPIVADLLSFDGGGGGGGGGSDVMATSAAAPAFMNFDAFSPQAPAPTTATALAPTTAPPPDMFDPFQNSLAPGMSNNNSNSNMFANPVSSFASAAPTPPTADADPFGLTAGPSFDPFGGPAANHSTAQHHQQQQHASFGKKPVMNSFGAGIGNTSNNLMMGNGMSGGINNTNMMMMGAMGGATATTTPQQQQQMMMMQQQQRMMMMQQQQPQAMGGGIGGRMPPMGSMTGNSINNNMMVMGVGGMGGSAGGMMAGSGAMNNPNMMMMGGGGNMMMMNGMQPMNTSMMQTHQGANISHSFGGGGPGYQQQPKKADPFDSLKF